MAVGSSGGTRKRLYGSVRVSCCNSDGGDGADRGGGDRRQHKGAAGRPQSVRARHRRTAPRVPRRTGGGSRSLREGALWCRRALMTSRTRPARVLFLASRPAPNTAWAPAMSRPVAVEAPLPWSPLRSGPRAAQRGSPKGAVGICPSRDRPLWAGVEFFGPGVPPRCGAWASRHGPARPGGAPFRAAEALPGTVGECLRGRAAPERRNAGTGPEDVGWGGVGPSGAGGGVAGIRAWGGGMRSCGVPVRPCPPPPPAAVSRCGGVCPECSAFIPSLCLVFFLPALLRSEHKRTPPSFVLTFLLCCGLLV